MNIFIGGSKNIGRLSPTVKKMLCSIIRSNHHILIGDCYGIDLAVQHFLNEQKYDSVTVYTACNCARHNVGGWNEVIIATDNIGFSAHKKRYCDGKRLQFWNYDLEWQKQRNPCKY